MVYLVLDGDGRLDSTHLVCDYDTQTAVRNHAEKLAGLVAVLPVINDYRRPHR
jgi:hypothetical protein